MSTCGGGVAYKLSEDTRQVLETVNRIMPPILQITNPHEKNDYQKLIGALIQNFRFLRMYPATIILEWIERDRVAKNMMDESFYMDRRLRDTMLSVLEATYKSHATPQDTPDYSLSVATVCSGLLVVLDDHMVSKLIRTAPRTTEWFEVCGTAPPYRDKLLGVNGTISLGKHVLRHSCSGFTTSANLVPLPLHTPAKCMGDVKRVLRSLGGKGISVRLLDNVVSMIESWQKGIERGESDVNRGYLEPLLYDILSHGTLLIMSLVNALTTEIVPKLLPFSHRTQALVLSIVDLFKDDKIPIFKHAMPLVSVESYKMILTQLRIRSFRKQAWMGVAKMFDAPALYPERSTFYLSCSFVKMGGDLGGIPMYHNLRQGLAFTGVPSFPPVFQWCSVRLTDHTTVEDLLDNLDESSVFAVAHFPPRTLDMHQTPSCVASILGPVLRSLRQLVVLRAPSMRGLIAAFDELLGPIWHSMKDASTSRQAFVFSSCRSSESAPYSQAQAFVDLMRYMHGSNTSEHDEKLGQLKTHAREGVNQKLSKHVRKRARVVVCNAPQKLHVPQLPRCDDGVSIDDCFASVNEKLDALEKAALVAETLEEGANATAKVVEEKAKSKGERAAEVAAQKANAKGEKAAEAVNQKAKAIGETTADAADQKAKAMGERAAAADQKAKAKGERAADASDPKAKAKGQRDADETLPSAKAVIHARRVLSDAHVLLEKTDACGSDVQGPSSFDMMHTLVVDMQGQVDSAMSDVHEHQRKDSKARAHLLDQLLARWRAFVYQAKIPPGWDNSFVKSYENGVARGLKVFVCVNTCLFGLQLWRIELASLERSALDEEIRAYAKQKEPPVGGISSTTSLSDETVAELTRFVRDVWWPGLDCRSKDVHPVTVTCHRFLNIIQCDVVLRAHKGALSWQERPQFTAYGVGTEKTDAILIGPRPTRDNTREDTLSFKRSDENVRLV